MCINAANGVKTSERRQRQWVTDAIFMVTIMPNYCHWQKGHLLGRMGLLGAHAATTLPVPCAKHSECISHTCQATPQRARWVPGSARLVLLAARASGAGCLRVYELQGAGLALRGEAKSEHALHSGTFGASSLAERHLAAGDASGVPPSRFSRVCVGALLLECRSSREGLGLGHNLYLPHICPNVPEYPLEGPACCKEAANITSGHAGGVCTRRLQSASLDYGVIMLYIIALPGRQDTPFDCFYRSKSVGCSRITLRTEDDNHLAYASTMHW